MSSNQVIIIGSNGRLCLLRTDVSAPYNDIVAVVATADEKLGLEFQFLPFGNPTLQVSRGQKSLFLSRL